MALPAPMKRFLRRRAPVGALALTLLLSVGACDDDPFGLDDWIANPTQLFLYSLARPELNLPSAANLYQKFTLRVETPGATGNWDVALDTRDGELVFLTPLALGVESRARIATFPGMSFDEIRRAPSDTMAYVAETPVPVDLNTVYVVRTSVYPGPFGQSCSFYSKLQPLEVNPGVGTVRFVVDTNPICNNLDLVPPND